MLAAGGCDGAPPESTASTLEEPRVWQTQREPGGEPLGEWVGLGGALPADTISVTLMATGSGADLLSFDVRDLTGRVLVDASAPERSPNRLLRGHGSVIGAIPSASASLPLSTNFAVTAVRLGAAGGDESLLTVSAWIKRGSGAGLVPTAQRLSLALFLVGGAGDAAGSQLDVALAELTRIWRAAGIEIGPPARVQIDGAEGERLARIEVDPELGSDSPMVGEALQLSGRGPARALSLVVVSDVALLRGGGGLLALSGAIPVPPLAGTPRSGVVVNGALIRRDPVWAGQVIAHEVGHALGLYHTTERSLIDAQALHDQIDDTPDCPTDADREPRDGTLGADECQPHDAGNLMFWGTPRGATRLTAGQADIARRSALVR